MKKTFKLTHEKIKTPRLVDSIKSEVKKYIKRERRRALPSGSDFWAFDCRYGVDANSTTEIHEAEINKYISQAEIQELESFYLEVVAKPANRTYKPKEEVVYEDDDSEDYDNEDFEEYDNK